MSLFTKILLFLNITMWNGGYLSIVLRPQTSSSVPFLKNLIDLFKRHRNNRDADTLIHNIISNACKGQSWIGPKPSVGNLIQALMRLEGAQLLQVPSICIGGKLETRSPLYFLKRNHEGWYASGLSQSLPHWDQEHFKAGVLIHFNSLVSPVDR